MGNSPSNSSLKDSVLKIIALFLLISAPLTACVSEETSTLPGLGQQKVTGGALDGNKDPNYTPPLDMGAVGPNTDYDIYHLTMKCHDAVCISKPDIQVFGDENSGGSEDEGEEGGNCLLTTLVFKMTVKVGPMPKANSIIRIVDLDKTPYQYNDFKTNSEGTAEIKITIDPTPQLEFYVGLKMDPTGFVPSDIWKDCPNRDCVRPTDDFAKIEMLSFSDNSCDDLFSSGNSFIPMVWKYFNFRKISPSQ